jgi:hypothetical protein
LTLHFDLTLREIEKVFSILTLYYSSLPKSRFTNCFLVATLAILKVKQPKTYGGLSRELLDPPQFFAETGLLHIRGKSVSDEFQELVSDLFNFLLMSDADLTEAAKSNTQAGSTPKGPGRMGSWLVGCRIDRKNVIPYLCSRLDQFILATG